jgi:exodeoxyribonuclease VII small subunit
VRDSGTVNRGLLTSDEPACSVTTRSITDKTMAAAKKIDLEKSLAELEELVEELESGDLPLETAMKKFEDGIKLTRGCQAALKEAEQKVQILLKSAGGEKLDDFEIPDDEA